MNEQTRTPGQQALDKVVDFLNKVQMGMTQGAFLHAQLEVIAAELAAVKAKVAAPQPAPVIEAEIIEEVVEEVAANE